MAIGDITCDISGSLEMTYKSTSPDDPVYIYNPSGHTYSNDLNEKGIMIMAVDNLPCGIIP